jgi:uncharacterized membrane protein
MSNQLIDRYLDDLRDDVRDLPKRRQNELVAEIKDHIDSALAETPDRDEVTVRNVLERLGDPADIADEARERMGIPRPKAGFREIAAVILLPIGGIIIPVIGWIVGLILLWSSPVWTSRDKWIGSLIIPGGLMLPFEFFFFQGYECSGTGPCGPSGFEQALITIGFTLLVAAPIVTAIYLARRANTLSKG